MQELAFTLLNNNDQITISTPKFEGFKSLNIRNTLESQKMDYKIKNYFENNNPNIEKRFILSERKNEKEQKYKTNYELSKSSDKKIYFSSIYNNYQKMNKDFTNSDKQISFDEKSNNFFFANKYNININNKTEIKDCKYFEQIVEENNIIKDKKEKDENFSYDLPLEMDKSSDIFNFSSSQIMNFQKDLNKTNNNNKNGVTKLQQFNINNLNINNNEKNKNLSKIKINFKKNNKNIYNKIVNNNIQDKIINNISNDNKNVVKKKSKKYFSFDGENQTSEDNTNKNKDKDKSKDNISNNDNKKINNNPSNEKNIDFLKQKKDIDIESIKKNIFSNDFIKNEINSKQYFYTEGKERVKNSIFSRESNKTINISNTQKKDFKKKLSINLLESEDNKKPKGYPILNNKRLINKNLIGYLAFNNSYSIKSKCSNLNDSSASNRKNKNASKICDKIPSKKLIFDNLDDSLVELNKKNKTINLNKKKLKHRNISYCLNETSENNSKDNSLNLQFNKYLTHTGNIDKDNKTSNDSKKSFSKNERFYKYISKNKPILNKISINSYDNYNSSMESNNKISSSKDKKYIKNSFQHEKNNSSINFFSYSNKNYSLRNNINEYSNTFEDKNIYNTINLKENKSNKILINKRNNTLKSIPMQKKINLIKVNKINDKNNIKNNENIKKMQNKLEKNVNNNVNNKLSYTNSTKILKIKNITLNNLNIENNNKISNQNFTHKTSKIKSINNLKKKIESLKKLNNSLRNNSHENYIKSINQKKDAFNKNKINNKTMKIIITENNERKKLVLTNKGNYFLNNYNYKNYNSRNHFKSQTLNNQYLTSQNKHSSISSLILKDSNKYTMINSQNNKFNDNNIKSPNILNFIKPKNNHNNKEIFKKFKNNDKLKNIYYKNDIIKNNFIKKNPIKKRSSIKIDSNNCYSFEVNSSMNVPSEIIKYNILRNNQNNQVSQVISETLGKKENYRNYNENYRSEHNLDNNYKKTIINVNQYYPSYYINTNNIDRTNEEQNKNGNNLFNSNPPLRTIVFKNKK